MDSDPLNRWLTLGANFAVLIGIVFLAIEIRQNTEMTSAQITQSRADTSISLAESFYNSEYLPQIWQKANANEALSAEELVRYHFWLRALLRNLDNNYQQADRGLLGDHIPRAVASAIGRILANPLAIDYWEDNKDIFSDEFRRFVDTTLSEGPVDERQR